MGGFGGAIGNANFNEPQNDDPTSAPAMPDQQQPQQLTPGAQKIVGGLAAALAKRKKQGPVGPTVKKPSDLTAAIARSRRARQGGMKYG